MKRILVAVVMLCSLSNVARADEASKRVKVEKLVTVMHMDSMVDQMSNAIKAQSAQMMEGMPGSEEFNAKQKALVVEFQGKLMDLAMSELDWKKLEPLMADTYMKSFTEEEVDGMLTFYSSPVGQSVLTKMPEVMKNSMSLMQGNMKDLMPKVQDLAQEYGAKIKAAGETTKK